VSPEAMRRTAFATLALAAATGTFLVAVGGWPILAVGVASLVCAVAYTGGPWPLAYHGLGEVFVFTFFGVIAVNGTVFLQTGSVSGLSLLASVPVGCLATAILVVNNLRDAATDGRAGKRTLAVRMGEAPTRRLHYALVATAFLASAGIGALIASGAALALVAMPLGVAEGLAVARRRGAELNRSLAGAARLHLAFGILLAIGLRG
ncbi:MAG: 1,4-dihydroxy-2-naphthoate octaprenyltransferase, partial [Candidatus Binatia bacterium]